ncbi:MAG: iron ABC transporter permease [Chloroflexi bacterium]|nr:iron ABC transporter permease [Chloroflexota bacterium]MCI0579984.1 iron ABC transporter permease [Chloroflexota bacterium]MCI0647484.1 iron ABC transporter permease [Chloroflexota bacterium]MCI0728711.1 iron ABC transporter permease [Chloroflexota bacterium]
MATKALELPGRLTVVQKRRLAFIALVLLEILLLALVGTWLIQVQYVEEEVQVVGDVERVILRREIVGDPALFALITLGLLLPFASGRLRREPVLLVALQAAVVGLIVFVLWPLGQVFVEGFKAAQGAEGFSLVQFERLLQQPMVARATTNTLILGLVSATLATAIGTLVAYTLTLTDIPRRATLRILTILPLVSPPFAVSFAFILLFGRRGIITYDLLHITEYTIYGPQGVILVQLISDIPLVALILSAVFASISRDLEEAAQDLGGRPLFVLRTVTFPLVTPAILTAFLLSFISSISDFGNPMLIGGGFQVLATQAFIQLIELFDLQLGAALSMILIIPALLAFLLQHWITSRRSYITVTSGAKTGHIRKLPPWLKWPLFGLTLFMAFFNLLLYGSIFVGAFVRQWGFDYTPTFSNLSGLVNALPMLRNSVVVSVGAGIVGGLVGLLIAWLVARQQFPGRRELDFAATVMYAVPGTVVGIGYIIAFNAAPYFWTGTFFIIIVAYAYRRLPVGLRTGIAAQKQIDPTLEEASLDLGASRLRTFARITFPLLNRAFLAGVIYIFIRSMTDLSSAVFLNSGRTQLFTVRMFRVMTTGTPSQAAAFAALLIVIILLSLGLLSKVTGKSFVDLFRVS